MDRLTTKNALAVSSLLTIRMNGKPHKYAAKSFDAVSSFCFDARTAMTIVVNNLIMSGRGQSAQCGWPAPEQRIMIALVVAVVNAAHSRTGCELYRDVLQVIRRIKLPTGEQICHNTYSGQFTRRLCVRAIKIVQFVAAVHNLAIPGPATVEISVFFLMTIFGTAEEQQMYGRTAPGVAECVLLFAFMSFSSDGTRRRLRDVLDEVTHAPTGATPGAD